MHLLAGCVFKQQTSSQMLDFHEGLGSKLVGRLATLLAGSPACWLALKCVKNAHPYHESASKMRTLKQKVGAQPLILWGTNMRQKREPLARKSVENAYP